MVRQREAHRGGGLRNGALAQHRIARRAVAMGVDSESARRVRYPGLVLCTDLDAEPEQIISWFVRRWQMEGTFQEVRQRLSFETQRHWSEGAARRAAPALLGLFSLVALFANSQKTRMSDAVRRAAWYDKPHPTFSDALALVRKELWAQEAAFCGSLGETETV